MGNIEGTINNNVIDSSNSMFLHPSDIPGISLVHTPFSDTGFGGWKTCVIVSLSARNKIGFVDGTCPKPAENSPHIKQWNRCNNKIISWLTSSLSPEIAESVQYSETAESIWEQLNKIYRAVNGTKVFEIKKELASTMQGALDISSYFKKLNLWDELRVMRSNKVNACACPIKVELLKEEEEDRVHQFLIGLNDIYVEVKSNILMIQPIPSLDST
ncbi:PREDICTED: uncharacterized protein LOC109230169 [Nicotiana attenuata]|uniref:uncharacterized protein LOC109230169 n=1 Tax=Nicotiana attenuata TaxID=49451 RepID=UPI000905CF1F|nr:PREDICTED: uncharacterized protein LOC109230169 [Nicotiana attenuata]